MAAYNEMLDLSHCVRKEAAFSAKAKAATDPLLRSTYEAAAREYAYRAALIDSKNAM